MVAIANFFGGARVLFWNSRTGGTRILGYFMRKTGNDDGAAFTRWHARLHGHDSLAVFVGRTLPLMRKPTAIRTAIVGNNYRSFVIGAIPAGFLGSGAPLLIGYLIKDDEQRFAAEYTRLSHVLVLFSPAVGLAIAGALWVRTGKSRHTRFSRTRAFAGLFVVVIAIGFATYTGWKNEWSQDPAGALLPTPLLELWLAALGGLLLALLGIAIHDLRNSGNPKSTEDGRQRPRHSATQAA